MHGDLGRRPALTVLLGAEVKGQCHGRGRVSLFLSVSPWSPMVSLFMESRARSCVQVRLSLSLSLFHFSVSQWICLCVNPTISAAFDRRQWPGEAVIDVENNYYSCPDAGGRRAVRVFPVAAI